MTCRRVYTSHLSIFSLVGERGKGRDDKTSERDTLIVLLGSWMGRLSQRDKRTNIYIEEIGNYWKEENIRFFFRQKDRVCFSFCSDFGLLNDLWY